MIYKMFYICIYGEKKAEWALKKPKNNYSHLKSWCYIDEQYMNPILCASFCFK